MNDAGSATAWQRSHRCDTGHCVEIARADEHVMMRDSIDPAGPVLTFSTEGWLAFTAGIREGEFDNA